MTQTYIDIKKSFEYLAVVDDIFVYQVQSLNNIITYGQNI